MTRRNLDWSPLDVWGDPVPGDPGYVTQQSVSMRSSADAMHSAAHNLRRLEAPATCSEAVAKILVESSKAAELLDEAGDRYHSVAEALATYAPHLTHAQDESFAALQQAIVHQADERAAYKKSVGLYWQAKATIDPVEREHLIQRYKQASGRQATAKGSLDAAKNRLHTAIQERDEAANRAAGAVDAASSGGKLNDSAWDKFADFVEPLVDAVDAVGKWIWEHIDEISLVLTIAAIALAWVPGLNVVLAALAAGANVLSKAKAAYAFVAGVAEGVRTGNWGAAAMGATGLVLSFVGGRAVGAVAKKVGAKVGAKVTTAVTTGVRKTLTAANTLLKRRYQTLAVNRVHHLRQLVDASHMERATTNNAIAAMRKSPYYHQAAPQIDKLRHAGNEATRGIAAKADAILATVKGTDLTHEMRDAVQDLVKLGRHHDMSDALIKEISHGAGDAAGRYAQHEVTGQIKDRGEQLVDAGAHWADERMKELQTHRVSSSSAGAR